MNRIIITVFSFVFAAIANAQNESQLWFKGHSYNRCLVTANVPLSPTLEIAKNELYANWAGKDSVCLVFDRTMASDGGYRIVAGCAVPKRSLRILGVGKTTIYAGSEIGLLYGTYELLRQQATWNIKSGVTIMPGGRAVNVSPADAKDKQSTFEKTDRPYYSLRILNHWDNLDGSIERGYAGRSLWKWDKINALTGAVEQHTKNSILQYCRANASVGINGSVLNNVNASPRILTTEYLRKVKVLADLFRPYGIRVYLSVNFASPKSLGYTSTADPLDPEVQAWWQQKVKEIYLLIPDFGGFLVKANSEGQPGPCDYGRTHADGANMFADALQPYGGIVMWRSFVYGSNHKDEDRAKQAVSEFKPMDGLFRSNVILQCKNGPLDFQPREPYAPIFDNMQSTPLMAEFQITQEYTGQDKHLVFLAPLWKEFFSFVSPDRVKGIAGVANVGDGDYMTGHPFAAANWYAFGRLAWNPKLTSEKIADEWLRQTFVNKDSFTVPMTGMMVKSREACVDYMMPLGLHHIFKGGDHYGPAPERTATGTENVWCSVYYHKADSLGVGFDRTATGSDAVSQYAEPYRSMFASLNTCPDNYLLWFHHVAWDYRMQSGRTLWEELCKRYDSGVAYVESLQQLWRKDIDKYAIDKSVAQKVDAQITLQLENAKLWRSTCLRYFGSFCKKKE